MPPDAPAGTGPLPAVVIEDLVVTYRVYADVRPTLRRFVASGFRPRPHTAVEALRGVSLTAYPGESIAVVGRNGSGKSTLMAALAGLLPATSGTVHASSTPVLLAVGAAMQSELSGRRNIIIGGSALGVPRAEVERRIDDIIEFTGLRDAIDRPIKTYSSGMLSRLQFGIASAVEPDILLIDEALATGDAEFAARSAGRVREICRGAGVVFLVSHALGTLLEMTERAVWIDAGRVRADGPTADVVAAYEHAVLGT